VTSYQPFSSLEQWDDFVSARYQPGKSEQQFRQFTKDAHPSVIEFYRQNHAYQTRELVMVKKREYGKLNRMSMGIWEAMEYLNTLVDVSDPDTDLSQIQHLLQTAEACRRDNRPDWFILAGLVHDLGKILCLFGEPQWAVVGDTFPTGCAWSEKIVYPDFFEANPDRSNARFQTRLGVYQEGCGLDRVDLSWGHDEYAYLVTRDYLPEEAQYILRYHSFYPWHHEGEYDYLCNDKDRRMLYWVKEFNGYDLYSKGEGRPVVEQLRPYYEELIARYFPSSIRW